MWKVANPWSYECLWKMRNGEHACITKLQMHLEAKSIGDRLSNLGFICPYYSLQLELFITLPEGQDFDMTRMWRVCIKARQCHRNLGLCLIESSLSRDSSPSIVNGSLICQNYQVLTTHLSEIYLNDSSLL